MAGRFGQTTAADKEKKRLALNADKTLKANKLAAKVFKDYLVEKQQNPDFEDYDVVRLDECLGHFYMDARKCDGTYYKATSLESIRHGLNRYLRNPPFNKKYDIVKDPQFFDSNINFKASLAELKRLGKGDVSHYPVIIEADREKIYTSMRLSTLTPTGLFNKVQFDIRLYFCRRGNENMQNMTKTTFKVTTDANNGLRYVKKAVDELTKNHRENDKQSTAGVMPEIPGSLYCPVTSFLKYLSRLNPENDRLWQRPKDSFLDTDEIWYCNAAVGEKKLKSFMTDLSKSCDLSQVYTNHSIRATGATVLSKNRYGAAQIMSVTGHKSVQSLTTYQRVSDEEKIQMGQTLSENIVPGSKDLTLPGPSTGTRSSLLGVRSAPLKELLPISNNLCSELVGVDLNDILNEFTPAQSNVQNVSNIMSTTQNSVPQVFSNCSVTIIHNLTVNK